MSNTEIKKIISLSMEHCDANGNEGRFRGVIIDGEKLVYGCVNLITDKNGEGLCGGDKKCIFKFGLDPVVEKEKIRLSERRRQK
jgi:hypothetical protein